jgi:hypothetical protein
MEMTNSRSEQLATHPTGLVWREPFPMRLILAWVTHLE